MNFLVDAHLPRRVALRLRERGHDVRLTLDLPLANRTTDGEINDLSLQEQRIVITKDSDFVDSLILRGKPWKLLLITTGNIGNVALLELLDAQLGVNRARVRRSPLRRTLPLGGHRAHLRPVGGSCALVADEAIAGALGLSLAGGQVGASEAGGQGVS